MNESMTELEELVRVSSDRHIAALHANLDHLRILGQKDPETWTVEDRQMAHWVVSGAIGLLLSGRI